MSESDEGETTKWYLNWESNKEPYDSKLSALSTKSSPYPVIDLIFLLANRPP